MCDDWGESERDGWVSTGWGLVAGGSSAMSAPPQPPPPVPPPRPPAFRLHFDEIPAA